MQRTSTPVLLPVWPPVNKAKKGGPAAEAAAPGPAAEDAAPAAAAAASSSKSSSTSSSSSSSSDSSSSTSDDEKPVEDDDEIPHAWKYYRGWRCYYRHKQPEKTELKKVTARLKNRWTNSVTS